MAAHFGRFVAYYRVSTDKQGQSGLGLEAQREAVMDYLNGGPWQMVAEHTEVESGKRNARPELEKALAACRRHKAKLVIAKLDRLSRNLHFITSVMESGVEFIACDNPHANKLTIHILAAVAEHEREAISERTKAALPPPRRAVRSSAVHAWQQRAERPSKCVESSPMRLPPTCDPSSRRSRRAASPVCAASHAH